MNRRLSLKRLAALAACGLAPVPAARADSTDVAGVKYERELALAGSRLLLNGAGIRYKAIFKVYAAGLYLTARVTTPEAVYASPGPRRMHIVMLREIDSNELGKLFTKGIEQNSTREEFMRAIPGTIKLGEIFAMRKNLAKGDAFFVDWLPGVGTQIIVNGKQLGDTIPEIDFYNALLRIWLGKSPVDWQLKDALLGKERPA